MSIELKVGQRVRLNNGEEHEVYGIAGGRFLINGYGYPADGIGGAHSHQVAEIISQPEQAAWKPKAGEDAVTRDGGRVTEVTIVEKGYWPVKGRVNRENYSWTKEGRYDGCEIDSQLDLVGPWVEPERDDWDAVIRAHEPETVHDAVNHPKHYTAHPSGVECIEITEHMCFLLGNSMKYIWRAGDKGDTIEDLEKAKWYLERKIALLKVKRDAL